VHQTAAKHTQLRHARREGALVTEANRHGVHSAIGAPLSRESSAGRCDELDGRETQTYPHTITAADAPHDLS
jgi:hypothetical protein